MTEQAKEEKRKYMREYMKAYRKKNKSKLAEIQEKFWERKAQSQSDDFIEELKKDSSTMNELKSEKLSESLETDDLQAFYVEDLENIIIDEVKGITHEE